MNAEARARAVAVLTRRIQALAIPASAPPSSVLICRAGGQRFAVDLALVERVVPLASMTPSPAAPAWHLGLLQLGDDAVPVFDLAARAAGVAREADISELIVIMRADDRRLGVVVAAVDGVIEVPAASVEAPAGPLADWAVGMLAVADGAAILLEPAALLDAESTT